MGGTRTRPQTAPFYNADENGSLFLGVMDSLSKIAKQFFPYVLGGVVGVSPAEGVAEKPQALKRGGDFPLFNVC
jgi:hypothetical protein